MIPMNQQCTWKPLVSVGGYPPKPQEPGTLIWCRWEGKRRMVRNAAGLDVVSEARAYVQQAVKPGDVLNYGGRDWPIISVSEQVDLAGTVQYREVAL